MKTTTEIGDELRDHVINLLEARGVTVDREVRLGTKKVDILATLHEDFGDRRVAIECRNLNRNLSQDEVNQVYAAHLNLLQGNNVDAVWIVVRLDFSPEAKFYAETVQGLKLFTLAQFEERQFSFKRFVGQLTDLFKDQDLDQYYIPQRLGRSELLIDRVKNWINGDDARPVAILGGYGMGKTSFCKYLIHDLGSEYLADQSKRVPIYIRLSEIAKEQELDGLLGKMLASRYRLSNYNFHDIMSLNRRGKFVFIFDGFDEMKHALTWDLFKYNFSQINQAVAGDARVIIAGRPNAFLSDAEHSWALRGTRIAGDQRIRMPDWPQYHELEIQPFDQPEAQNFLRQYLSQHLVGKNESLNEDNQKWVESRIREFDSLQHRKDFARPVHLKIFADIATNRDLKLKDFSIYELYELSTQQTIDREMEKIERLPISGDKRSAFLEDVGWWLWTKDDGRALNFNPYEVPTGLVRKVLTADQQRENDGLLRELFSGAFIERKFGDNFYFAHRSFLEFFVARKLGNVARDKIALSTINNVVNEEILVFLKSGPHYKQFIEFVTEQMERYSGELKFSLLQELAAVFDRNSYLRRPDYQQHVELIFKVLPLYGLDEEPALRVFEGLLTDDIPLRNSGGSILDRAHNAFYYMVDALLYYSYSKAFNHAIIALVNFMISRTDFAYMRRTRAAGGIVRNLVKRSNLFEYCLISFSSLGAGSADGGRQIVIDWGRMLAELGQSRLPKIVVANRSAPVPSAQFTSVIPIEILSLSASDQSVLVDVLRENRDQL